ncbi:hypothetical protein DJ030_16350 [bacterium endosymbiont of Escarpia laminata]|nr:MAG: hypothetical protein DJ030_16350 [bacterium endosymbiont of Escarpia laminata]
MSISNLEEFRDRRAAGRAEAQRKRQQKIEEEGGIAYTSMREWDRRIPQKDRVQLARNFQRIWEDIGLKPRDLEESSSGSLRTNLSRMRNPEGKYIIATSAIWLHYIDLILNVMDKRNKKLPVDLLMLRLTRGTRFHPLIQKTDDRESLLIPGYELKADEIGNKFELLDTYRSIAKKAVENNNQVAQKGVGESLIQGDSLYSQSEAPLSSFLTEEYLEERGWAEKQFFDLSLENLIEFRDILRECEEDEFKQTKIRMDYGSRSLSEYVNAINVTSILFYEDDSLISLYSGKDRELIPHCLLGISREGWVIPGSNSDEDLAYWLDNDGVGGGHVYLILYPDMAFERIVPYILILEDEATRGDFLANAIASSDSDIFVAANQKKDAQVEYKTLTELLLDVERISSQLIKTSENLINHPVLMAEREKDDQLEAAIQGLFEELH